MGRSPRLASSAFIAPGAFTRGCNHCRERLASGRCSLRGDIAPIVIGAHSNVQDGSVVHVADDLPAIVGEWVTVGHKAIVHACGNWRRSAHRDGSDHPGWSQGGGTLHRRSQCYSDNRGTEIPAGSLVLGSPAVVKKTLSSEEQSGIRRWAVRYVTLSRLYLARTAGARKRPRDRELIRCGYEQRCDPSADQSAHSNECWRRGVHWK